MEASTLIRILCMWRALAFALGLFCTTLVRRKRLLAVLLIFSIAGHAAQTITYDASCEGSHYKQGEEAEDLRQQSGVSVVCNLAILEILDNSRILLRTNVKLEPSSSLTFGGSYFDYGINPEIAISHLDVLFPQRPATGNNSSEPEKFDGIEGDCYFTGKVNLRSLTKINSVAKVKIGSQKRIYAMNIVLFGTGKIFSW
jgi:hypothetical protein